MSDADRIKAEVERRKQKAWQLGLPAIVTEFYRELARFYPSWKQNRPALVPQSLASVEELGRDSVELTYRGDRYAFSWREHTIDLPNGDVSFSGTIELLFNSSRVFEVDLEGKFNEDTGTEWRPSDILAFIEGPWATGLNALAAEGKRLYACDQDRIEALGRADQLAELQGRFGIPSDHNAGVLSYQENDQQTKTEGGDASYRIGVVLGTWLKRFLKRLSK